jgi:hypothetical protein
VSLSAFRVVVNVATNLQPAASGTETSGIAASRHSPGVLWIHDDSGHAPQLNALRQDGRLAQQYQLLGVSNRDWEDVAIGPGPVVGRDYLYVADIGNNALSYTSFAILRVPEPDVPSMPSAVRSLTPEVFRFRYPGQTHNAETLWIDPFDGSPFVLTKETGNTCTLYRYPLPLDAQVEKTMQLAATLSNAPVSFTGGAIAPDGRWIFARTYLAIHAWPRALGQSFVSAITSSPCTVLNVQGQAEAISVTPDGAGLLAVSEGAADSIYRCDLSVPAGSAAWFAFGTGLPGTNAVPGLGLARAPILGQAPLTLAVWQGRPLTAGYSLLSPTAYPDGQVPFYGGWLHAAPDTLLAINTDANGEALLTLGVIPDLPALRGVTIHSQALLIDASSPQGVALSAGLSLRFDR